jgi:putative endonuclease
MADYYVYMVKCADTTLYTGVCTNLERRVKEHNTSLRGAKYTRTRRPVTLVYSEEHPSRSAAQSREYTLKRLSKSQKELLAKKST